MAAVDAASHRQKKMLKRLAQEQSKELRLKSVLKCKALRLDADCAVLVE